MPAASNDERRAAIHLADDATVQALLAQGKSTTVPTP
jgi:hypothetical protein